MGSRECFREIMYKIPSRVGAWDPGWQCSGISVIGYDITHTDEIWHMVLSSVHYNSGEIEPSAN